MPDPRDITTGSPDAPMARLEIADACLEEIANAATSEEGVDLAEVASGYAMVVIARHIDHQNHLLASLARTVEGIERHLALIAQAAAGMGTPIPPGQRQTLSPFRIEMHKP